MYYELALISVLVAGGYWGWFFVRHDATRLYGALQLTAAGLCGLGLIGERSGASGLGIPGAIGVGAGVCLLVVGPFARGLARRFAATERFGAAKRMLDVAEVLAPGSGVDDEKALLATMREIRDGNIEQTVVALTAAKDRAPADARIAIDERIAMLYLASYRWDEAVAHAEAHLFGALPASPVERGSQVAVRRVLGIAPPVWVELLAAYGYKGDLDQAALMLARLEDVCAGRPEAGIWLHRGRLMFLALAGRVSAVQQLVDPKCSRHMKPSARKYWIAVAHERQGSVTAAEAAYARARAGTRGRPRVLIDQALDRLKHAHGERGAGTTALEAARTFKPAELGSTATAIVARVEAEPVPVVVERQKPRGPIATRVLAVAVIAYAATISFGLDSATDVGTLMRSGAMVRGLVEGGEWWRLVTYSFVHVGGVHLIVNLIGLWFLGRLVEDVFGPWRTIAIFGCAGIAGAFASFLAAPAGISAGASGAIFGLLGAVFIELSLHRHRHRMEWTRGVWGMLAVITVAQVGIGFVDPVIDQWAHGAGLIVGSLAGMLLSPNARWTKLAEHAARVLAIGFAVLVAVSTLLVARTSIADSLATAPRAWHALRTVHVIAPATWSRDGDTAFDSDLVVILSAQRMPATEPLAAQLDEWVKSEPERARSFQFDHPEAARDQLIALPPAWRGTELVVSIADSLGGRQRYRVLVAGRSVAGGTVRISLYAPESVARAAPEFFTQLVASVQ